MLVTYDAFGVYGHPDHIQAHRVALVAAEAAGTVLYPDGGEPWRIAKVYLATLPRSVAATVHEALVARGLASPFAGDDGGGMAPFGSPDEVVTTAVDVRPFIGAKMAAVRAHRSQIGPDSFFLNVPDDLVEAAFGTEWFIRHRSDIGGPSSEDDLLAGLRARLA